MSAQPVDVLDGFSVDSLLETPECFSASQTAAARRAIRNLLAATKTLQERHARFYMADEGELVTWEDADDDAQAAIDRVVAEVEGQP